MNLKILYNKYVNWVVVLLLLFSLFKGCQSCNRSNLIEWNNIQYKQHIDSLNNDIYNYKAVIDSLNDEINICKLELENIKGTNELLLKTNKTQQETNKALINTNKKLIKNK